MFFLKWSHLKQDNTKLKEYLAASGHTGQNLQIHDGFFIAPDDLANEANVLPKIITSDRSIVDIFGTLNHKIYEDVVNFYRIVGGFDRRDYKKFKTGAKIAYFFAVSYYACANKLNLTKINTAYSGDIQKEVEKNLSRYLLEFISSYLLELIELSAKSPHKDKVKDKVNLFDLFPHAKANITHSSPNLKLPDDFNNNSFSCF